MIKIRKTENQKLKENNLTTTDSRGVKNDIRQKFDGLIIKNRNKIDVKSKLAQSTEFRNLNF